MMMMMMKLHYTHNKGHTDSTTCCEVCYPSPNASIPAVQVDAITGEEQQVIASNDKTDVGRVMMNEDTRCALPEHLLVVTQDRPTGASSNTGSFNRHVGIKRRQTSMCALPEHLLVVTQDHPTGASSNTGSFDRHAGI